MSDDDNEGSKKLRQKNYALLWVLLGVAVLLFFITIVKISHLPPTLK